jgi:hypothetical protein
MLSSLSEGSVLLETKKGSYSAFKVDRPRGHGCGKGQEQGPPRSFILTRVLMERE